MHLKPSQLERVLRDTLVKLSGLESRVAMLERGARAQAATFDHTLEGIVDRVGMVFGVTATRIMSKEKSAQVAMARMVAMHLGNQAGRTRFEVARYFGKLDRKTVAHASKTVACVVEHGSGNGAGKGHDALVRRCLSEIR